MSNRIFFDRDVGIVVGRDVSNITVQYIYEWFRYRYPAVVVQDSIEPPDKDEYLYGDRHDGYVFDEEKRLPMAFPVRQEVRCRWERDHDVHINSLQPDLGPQFGPKESTPLRNTDRNKDLECGKEKRFNREEELLWTIRQLELGVNTGETVFCGGGMSLSERGDRTYVTCHGDWVDDVMVPGGTIAAFPGRAMSGPAYFDVTGDGINDLVFDLEVKGERGIRIYFMGLKK